MSWITASLPTAQPTIMSLAPKFRSIFDDGAAFSSNATEEPPARASSIELNLSTTSLLLLPLVIPLAFFLRGKKKSAASPVPTPRRPRVAAPTGRDRFKARKVPDDLEYIVIGSGISGLSSAALLARTGRKVLVLEQHYVAGGCMHAFKEAGFEWDSGVHYIGGAKEMIKILSLATGLKESDVVPFEQIGSASDGYAYDEIHVGDRPVFPMRAGRETFAADLKSRFPDEAAAVDKYVALCLSSAVSAVPWWVSKLLPASLQALLLRSEKICGTHLKLARMTVHDALRVECGVVSDELYAILVGQFLDYGSNPTKDSFLPHAAVFNHFAGGAWYPHGGPQALADMLVKSIESHGGRVLVAADVERILVERGRAVGVRVNGEDVRASRGVISSAGCNTTAALLEPSGTDGKVPWASALAPTDEWEGSWEQPAEPEKRSGELSQGVSHVMCFVGLDGEAEELGLKAANQWHLQVGADGDIDVDGEVGAYHDDHHGAMASRGVTAFISCNSAKDPTYASREPGKSCVTIIAAAEAKWFSEWVGTKSGKRRSAAYAEEKEEWEKVLLATLHKAFPKTAGKVLHVSTSTPLTNAHYLGRAASYGLDVTATRFGGSAGAAIRPRVAGVRGLYLTGQDLIVAGWAGALLSSVISTVATLLYDDWSLFGMKLAAELIAAIP